MKTLAILGAGTAGTMMANHLRRKLDKSAWKMVIVDENPDHYYQPGYLFMPFDIYNERDVVKPKQKYIPNGVDYLSDTIEQIDADANRVVLESGTQLEYDVLIIATGTDIAPEETEGLLGEDWQKNTFDFYTFEGARRLSERMKHWEGGRLVINIAEMPIKCPVAPLEFSFLADWWLDKKGLREKTEIVYVTPLSGAFTKPVASRILDHLLERKGIEVVSDFSVGRVDNDNHKIVSWDEREVDYDLLVSVPTNMGSPVMERSGLGDELNYVPTDKHSLQSKAKENIFVLGDATDVPTSKAGSVAHFQAEVLTENILSFIRGEPLEASFDGHANCFIESGYGKGFLLDFNYDLEPVPGHFPIPKIGPLSLLGESRLNHLGKLAFKYVYWHALLKAIPLPMVSHKMTMAGKQVPKELLATA
jgi:sulfide:quinone oxidoreductase